MTSRTRTVLLSALALSIAGAPAFAATKHAKNMAKASAPQASTEDLNAQSLAAAQQGKNFMPAGTPATPAK